MGFGVVEVLKPCELQCKRLKGVSTRGYIVMRGYMEVRLYLIYIYAYMYTYIYIYITTVNANISYKISWTWEFSVKQRV